LRQRAFHADRAMSIVAVLAGGFALCESLPGALQPRPFMAFLRPGDIADHGVGSSFDTAVIAIDRLALADRRILEWLSARLHQRRERFCPEFP
jgi:hypothetical protein